MLEIKNLTKIFNKDTINEKIALCGVNLTIFDGDFITVIGGNGAGKSTLLNAIAGVFEIEGGEIALDGASLVGQKEYKRARYLGRVFQDPMTGTCADMQVEENLALSYRRGKRRTFKWGVGKSEKQLYKTKLASLCLGLENNLEQKTGTLSGGQRQALTLVMATLNKPKLLLLDEHTAALDPKTAQTVLDITEKLTSESKITTLMVTHNMADALKYGNKIIMMDNGKIVFEAEGEEKHKLTVDALLQKFKAQNVLTDRTLLA